MGSVQEGAPAPWADREPPAGVRAGSLEQPLLPSFLDPTGEKKQMG